MLLWSRLLSPSGVVINALYVVVTVYKETPKKVEMKVTPQSPSHLPLHLAQYLVFTLTQILYFLQEDHWIALPVLKSRGKWTELKKFFCMH